MARVLALVIRLGPEVPGLVVLVLFVGERPIEESWSSEDKVTTSVSRLSVTGASFWPSLTGTGGDVTWGLCFAIM